MPLKEWHILYEARPLHRRVWLVAGGGLLIVSFWMLREYDSLTMYLAKLLLVACGVLWNWVPRARKTGIGAFVPVSRSWADWVMRYTGVVCLAFGLFAPRIVGGFDGTANRFWVIGAGLMVFAAGVIAQNSRRRSDRYDYVEKENEPPLSEQRFGADSK